MNGRYPLGAYLGGTKQSAVYLTNSNGSKAAIKLIAADAREARNHLARWEMASRLSHPHMIRILDVGSWHADDEQDMLFAVMEYADENLAESRRALTAAEARQMLDPTLDALRYLHAQGLIHNRLTPGNVMAVGEQLKLSSDNVRRMGKVDAVVGSGDPYDAPEKASGAAAPSGDIWSLGVMLVQALTNRLPELDGKGEVKLPNLPSPFDDIVKHCMSRDPEQRWSAAEIKKQLERPPLVADSKLIAGSRVAVDESRKIAAGRVGPVVPPATSPSRADLSVARAGAATSDSALLAKRRMILPAAVIALVLIAILVGIRVSRHGSSQDGATSVSTSSATATKSPVSVANAPTATTSATNSTSRAEAAVRHEVLPNVTRRARNSINGTVKVKVKVAVDASGKVSHAALADRGPSAYFAKQSLQAARQWSFTAPQVHGQPAGTEWALTFEFRRSGTKAGAQRVS